MSTFREEARLHQIAWRKTNIADRRHGSQNGGQYEHVLPRDAWELNLWPQIRSEAEHALPPYLREHDIQRHTGSHNLLSSWMLCANLYFPFRREEDDRALLAGFLRTHVASEVQAVTGVELEFSHAVGHPLHPRSLLGEADGHRGSGQTSPDVAFKVQLADGGSGIVLTENKFTEHSFYACSGRKKSSGDGRPPNPSPDRCLDAGSVLRNPTSQCHLVSWGRRYWDHLLPIADPNTFAKVRACPAAYAGYQLLRQQALAEGMAKSGLYRLVVSSVAYDARNQDLFGSLARRGMEDWAELFRGKARFKVFTHQSWVGWVRRHAAPQWADWLAYVQGRYGY